MSKKQGILIILSLILIVAAACLGWFIYRTYNIEKHQDAIVSDIMKIAEIAYRYRSENQVNANGSGLYRGFMIPADFAPEARADYRIKVSENGGIITIYGDSKIVRDASIYAHFDLQLNFLLSAISGQRAPSSQEGTSRDHFFFRNGW